jgi:hypothetical protein
VKVNSFWDGARLTALEQLCISSFLAHGIEFHLYVYDPPAGVPEGTTLRDAAALIPREKLFRYQAGEFNLGSVSGFANLFRYSLIAEQGGWWVDTDICCLKPFEFDEPEVFFSEASQDAAFRVATAIFKASPQSAVVLRCLELFQRKDVKRLVHGETGPALLTDVITEFGEQSKVRSHELFFPVPWWEYRRLFDDASLNVTNCYSVHFWNAMISAANVDLDASFADRTLFQQLKQRFLV